MAKKKKEEAKAKKYGVGFGVRVWVDVENTKASSQEEAVELARAKLLKGLVVGRNLSIVDYTMVPVSVYDMSELNKLFP